MPAIEDYMATRCLLLSGLFVGLTLAHEATEKIMKSLLIIEKTAFPKSCHDLTTLAELLIKKDAGRYGFLNKEKKFLERLDKHYGWRYHDGDITKRSKTKSASELHPVDKLWMLLYERYLGVLPDRKQSRDLLAVYLFSPVVKEYTNLPYLLLTDNRAIKNRKEWERRFLEWFTPKK